MKRDVTSMLLFGDAAIPSNWFYEAFGAERLYGDTGEFHGGYGWLRFGRTCCALHHDAVRSRNSRVTR